MTMTAEGVKRRTETRYVKDILNFNNFVIKVETGRAAAHDW
jgi:hypothetical protein